jgi:hypothetical protein
MMRKITLFIVLIGLILLFGNSIQAQVGINNDDPKSTLDITASATDMPSNMDGVLVPRIAAFPGIDPGADQDGMMVFLTTATGTYTKGFHYWDDPAGIWVRIGEFDQEWLGGVNAAGDSLVYAKRASLAGTDIVYTDDGRIGVGTDDPCESVEMRSNGDNDFQLTSANVNPPNLIFLNTGGTVESPSALAANQEIGSIIVKTNDGSQLVEVGGFRFFVDGTPSVGSVPSAFILSNTPNGSLSQIDRLVIRNTGNIGFTVANPTATLHLRAGTASTASAPLKFTNGTNLSTPEAGAMEFDGTNLYFTPNTSRKIMLTGLVNTATLDFPAINGLSTSELTITVAGATIGSSCSCAPNTTVEAGLSWSCYVSAANTVTVRLSNVSAGVIDPASKSWKVTVID